MWRWLFVRIGRSDGTMTKHSNGYISMMLNKCSKTPLIGYLVPAAATLSPVLLLPATTVPAFELDNMRRTWIGRQRELVAFDYRRRHEAPAEEMTTRVVDRA